MIETSGHLPECPKNLDVPGDCACEPLRACEQRVRAEYDEWKATLDGIEFGAERSWDYALDALKEKP